MELKGSTGVLSLFDLVQLLSVNEATGMLKVEEGGERGYLYFQAGTIINALDDEHREGEEAAKRVFALRDAEFLFATDLPSVAHRIQRSTQNLMMEIARQLDEEGAAPDGTTHGERVREAQQATEELNELFLQLDSESKILSHRSHQGFAVLDLIGSIRESSDSTLYLRPGAPPEVRAGERMIPLSETRVDRKSYETLRDHLLREAVPLPGAAGGEAEDFLLTLGQDEHYRLERLRWEGTEALIVRRLPGEEELASGLPWPAETLDEILAEPGSLALLTAPDHPRLAHAFAPTCCHLVAAGPGPLFGVARRWPPGLEERRAGTTLLTSLGGSGLAGGEALLDRVSPALVAVEDSDHPPSRSLALHALHAGSRTLVGICARATAHAPQRLLGHLRAEDRWSWTHHLGTSLTAVLSTDGSVQRIGETTRAAVLAGDLGALAKELAPRS